MADNFDPVQSEWLPRSTIAVLGGAATYTEAQIEAAYRIGSGVAARGHALLTGATSGIPYAAALGAHDAGGMVIGISPASCAEEHIEKFRKPLCQADVIIYTGMGPEGRSPLLTKSASAAIFVGGEVGTLGEFCSAWMCGPNVLGVLEAGGISNIIRDVIGRVTTSWGSEVLYGVDPLALVERVSEALAQQLSGSLKRSEPNDDVRQIIYRAVHRSDVSP